MVTTMARDLLMLNLKLILKLVCSMEDMVLDTAVGTLVVMDMEDTEDTTDKESNL